MSGTLAATSAPSATSRISSVIGSESIPALPTSRCSVSSIALLALPPPNWPTVYSGLSCLIRSTVAMLASRFSSATFSLPSTSNSTKAEWPSSEIPPPSPSSGEMTFSTCLVAASSVGGFRDQRLEAGSIGASRSCSGSGRSPRSGRARRPRGSARPRRRCRRSARPRRASLSSGCRWPSGRRRRRRRRAIRGWRSCDGRRSSGRSWRRCSAWHSCGSFLCDAVD